MYKLLKIAKKYKVEIDFRIRKGTIVSIIENDIEIKTVMNRFIKNHIAEVEQIAKEMYIKQEKYYSNMIKNLRKKSKNNDIFPTDLFKI